MSIKSPVNDNFASKIYSSDMVVGINTEVGTCAFSYYYQVTKGTDITEIVRLRV